MDVQKLDSRQSRLRTHANASEKVGSSFLYQAVRRSWQADPELAWIRWAASVIRENKPKRLGVVRAMACSFHCRCPSKPKWARTSWKVTSIGHRLINRLTTSNAFCLTSVLRRA